MSAPLVAEVGTRACCSLPVGFLMGGTCACPLVGGADSYPSGGLRNGVAVSYGVGSHKWLGSSIAVVAGGGGRGGGMGAAPAFPHHSLVHPTVRNPQ